MIKSEDIFFGRFGEINNINSNLNNKLKLLVKFGGNSSENTFNELYFKGWNIVVKSSNSDYQIINGHSGVGNVLNGAGANESYYGIASDTPFNFNEGGIIVASWYNGSAEIVKYIDIYGTATNYFKPMITFEDRDTAVNSTG